MNTKILLGILIIAMTLCMSSCQDDAEIILFSGSEPITQTGTCTNLISSMVIYLNSENVNQNIGIANGKGGYSVTSSNESIVTATIRDNRLLLTTHDKTGRVTIMVRDKKDNVVSLPVTVSYGVFRMIGISERFVALVNGQLPQDEALQEKVEEAMVPYSFMKKDWVCDFQPVNISSFFTEEGAGTFVICDADNVKSIEGAFKMRKDEFITGKSELVIDFSYNGGERTFFFNPSSAKDIDQTRDIGPIRYSLVEDVTNSQYLQSVTLPENSQVYCLISAHAFVVSSVE